MIRVEYMAASAAVESTTRVCDSAAQIGVCLLRGLDSEGPLEVGLERIIDPLCAGVGEVVPIDIERGVCVVRPAQLGSQKTLIGSMSLTSALPGEAQSSASHE